MAVANVCADCGAEFRPSAWNTMSGREQLPQRRCGKCRAKVNRGDKHGMARMRIRKSVERAFGSAKP